MGAACGPPPLPNLPMMRMPPNVRDTGTHATFRLRIRPARHVVTYVSVASTKPPFKTPIFS